MIDSQQLCIYIYNNNLHILQQQVKHHIHYYIYSKNTFIFQQSAENIKLMLVNMNFQLAEYQHY